MSYTEMSQTRAKLSLITQHAQRDKNMQFTSLAHLLNVEYLRECFYRLSRNKAVGIDDISWHDYSENMDHNLNSLVRRLKNKSYKPKPARRVYIPKGDGKFRPLGISAIENKIVERGIVGILESIYEQDFSECSYGFRPKKSCHQALKRLHDVMHKAPINHIVEADIKGFFDNVSHEILMNFIKVRITDRSLLILIEKFLKAGYVDKGLLVCTDTGTPQGSILSPILANIFLHYVLDTWYEQVVKKHVKGFCELIRYADDFICLVQYQDDAKRIERAIKNRFNRFKLEIHPEKSKRISFGRYEQENAKAQNRRSNTFTFLGITHYCTKSRAGNFKLGRKTSKKKFTAKCNEMRQWLEDNRCRTQLKVWWKTLASKLRGHFQYYGVSENYKSISAFYYQTIRSLHKWLNRRSQRGKMNWEQFTRYLTHYPLPKPSIKHSFYI